MFVTALGWVAALLAATLALPQLVRLLRTRSTDGVSVIAWRLTFAANIAWTLHGLYTAHLNVLVPNLVFAGLSFTILLTLGRDRRLPIVPLLAPSVLLALVTFGLDVWLGPVAFAVSAGLPSLLAQLMQFRELVVAPRITGVSMPFLALNVINQVCWFSWSLLAAELSVTLCASTIGSVMALNLVWALLRRQRVVRARLALLSA